MTDSPSLPPKRPRWAWITLVTLQLLQLLSLLAWLPIAGLSFMAFDATGSENMWQPWAFVIAIGSYPLWLLAAGTATWLLFAFRRPRTAVGIAVAFTLPMFGMLAVLLLGNLG